MTTTLPAAGPAADVVTAAAPGIVADPGPTEPGPPPPGRRRLTVGLVGWTLCVLAVSVLGFALWLVALTDAAEARAQENLYKTFRGQLRDAVAPVQPPIDVGTPVAVLEIPGLGIRQVVVEGTAGGQLANGPGHRRDTALPGQAGISVVYGRRATFGAPFRDVPSLRTGDEVRVTTGQGVATYLVLGGRHGSDPIPAYTATNLLNLVSSDPALSPSGSIIVTSALKGQPQPSGGTRTGITRAERSLAGDPSALLPLVLWGQVLLVTLAAATWAFVRWGRWQAYLVAIPVVLAVLWNVCENVARLLPNTL